MFLHKYWLKIFEETVNLELLDQCLEPGLALTSVPFCQAVDGEELLTALWRDLFFDALPDSEYSSIKLY